MKKWLYILVSTWSLTSQAQSLVTEENEPGSFLLSDAVILIDKNDDPLVIKSAQLLQEDIFKVTGKRPSIVSQAPKTASGVIMIATVSSIGISKMAYGGKIQSTSVRGKWEAYQLQSIKNFSKEIPNALIIIGSDRRGTAYGVFELSGQLGVSPWYWWADVPVKTNPKLRISGKLNIKDEPKVKYRGIFINDEAPALSNWSREKFGGFNHKFYEKVFELMLRLKANYIWPAMWGNAFYDDDSLNIHAAEEYGIVIGTSHHEPLMRAHDEWRRYGKKQKWNYDSTESGLKDFWRGGMQRATNERIVSVGMRGDGDEPMSRETATALLERIVKDQRTIIEEVTGKPANQTPQLWALYKEVQDYYDKGMRVPDDVTLLLCDDNWGNIRRLPKLGEKPREGGYGIYYHFDYVGGPRNYKWINTNSIPRIWEQMHLAWQYNARQIWIVNVGDIKPMEYPISFFLDYAWNPTKIGADDLKKYSEQWAAAQFGKERAADIADILTKYTKYNARRKPELLDASTYDLHTGEWQQVINEYHRILLKATDILDKLSPEYADAYYQLVLHPVKACANLHALYYAVALNRYYASEKWLEANEYADQAKRFYEMDSLITLEYHQINDGKWNHMMSQTHIGYTYWQQPPNQTLPWVKYVHPDSAVVSVDTASADKKANYPKGLKGNYFYEQQGVVSIKADHFTKAINSNSITWKILRDHGKTGSAITPFPVTARKQKPGSNSPHVQYEFYTYSTDSLKVHCYFSPTLNLHNDPNGLQFAISIDNGPPQIIGLNKDDNIVRIWSKWVADNINIKTTNHFITKPGKHVVKFWMVDPGVVLQKIVISFGKVELGYLGPQETIGNMQ